MNYNGELTRRILQNINCELSDLYYVLDFSTVIFSSIYQFGTNKKSGPLICKTSYPNSNIFLNIVLV